LEVNLINNNTSSKINDINTNSNNNNLEVINTNNLNNNTSSNTNDINSTKAEEKVLINNVENSDIEFLSKNSEDDNLNKIKITVGEEFFKLMEVLVYNLGDTFTRLKETTEYKKLIKSIKIKSEIMPKEFNLKKEN
jgi:hypothetical protein